MEGSHVVLSKDPVWQLRALVSGNGAGAEGRAATPANETAPESTLALDAVTDCVFVLDREQRLVRLNRAAGELLGAEPDILLGRRCFEVFHRREAPVDDCPHAALLQDGRLHTLRMREPHLGGNFDVLCLPLADADGSISGAVHVMRPAPGNDGPPVASSAVRSADQLRATLQATIRALGAVIALRDPDTANHQKRVADLAQALALEMGLPDDVVDSLWYCGHLHDIGKLGIPIDILGRPGALNPMERTLVRLHPQTAEEILSPVPFEHPIAQTVAQHHERLDGSGYPRGLTGDQISPEARILAVADVVAAMTAHRPHRPALSLDAVLAEVRRGSGTQFDAEVVAALERLAARGEIPTGE